MDHVAIRVPATVANLGPGFDCLGLAQENEVAIAEAMADAAHNAGINGRIRIAQPSTGAYLTTEGKGLWL